VGPSHKRRWGRSVEELRRYAQRTAAELKRAGVEPDALVVAGGVEEEQVEKVVGRIFKRKVTETVRHEGTVRHPGWRVWSRVEKIAEVAERPGLPGYGWKERNEIWLRPDGVLIKVRLEYDNWPGRGSPDRVLDLEEASDFDIGWADWPGPALREPRIPRNRTGLFESNFTMRTLQPGVKLPEKGTVISRGLTNLRKRSGTYVQRRPR
jgi:hypothetical protein